MLQFTPAQKCRLLALQQTYLMQLAVISKNRQQLLLQLQQVPEPQGMSHQELFSACAMSDTILQQLQDCSALEHKLYIQYFIAAAHGVSSRQPFCFNGIQLITTLILCSNVRAMKCASCV